MSCKFDEKILHQYLDNELGEATRQRLEKHLETCSICRRKLDTLQTIRIELNLACFETKAPAHLKARILSDLHAHKKWAWSYSDFIDRLKMGFLNLPARRVLAVGFVLAVAALLIINSSYTTLESMADELAEGYMSWPGVGQVDLLNSSDTHEVSSYLKSGFDIDVPLPKFLPDSLNLESAGVLYVGGRQIAHLRYSNGPAHYSLYIMQSSSIHHNGVGSFKSHGREFEITNRSDINLLSWQQGDFSYILCGCCCFDRLAGLASSTI
jgi:mycothiol system anti-sigma-R factor